MDMGKFLGISAPTVFRSGFRRLVFSVLIMVIVLFFRRGIMGDKEISWDLFIRSARRPLGFLRRKPGEREMQDNG